MKGSYNKRHCELFGLKSKPKPSDWRKAGTDVKYVELNRWDSTKFTHLCFQKKAFANFRSSKQKGGHSLFWGRKEMVSKCVH